MNFIGKVIRGDDFRKTRFHDEKGNITDLSGLPSIPKGFFSFIIFKLFGYRQFLPWISYNAIDRIESILETSSNVLEFGSGMSTIWFAERYRFVHSIEHDEVWHRRVSEDLKKRKLTNVRYDLRTDTDYADLAEYDEPIFDFCIVDGIKRLQCVMSAIPTIKSGGFIFLDNSDVGEPERRQAEAIILAAADERRGEVEYFVDFAPTQIHANQGMLARL